MLKLSVLLIFSVSKVRGNCGQPASHPQIWTHGSLDFDVAKEGHRLQFECEDALSSRYGKALMAYKDERICTRGKWSPRMPKCGKLVIF